jgi:DNA-binding CsgD family transcriptional regulator
LALKKVGTISERVYEPAYTGEASRAERSAPFVVAPEPARGARVRPFVGRAPLLRDTLAPTLLVFVILLFVVSDLASDIADHAPLYHMAIMTAGTVLSLVCLALMWRLVRRSRSQARALAVELDTTRADLVEWRAKAADTLQGLGALIDRQFDDWGLSPAERDVGLLLMKGFSLRDIGKLRQSSERTVRQQAQAVYSKANLAGRAELAAFFLEDLLPPPTENARTPAPGVLSA